MLWWVMDRMKGALKALAVAQKLVKPPKGNERQGGGGLWEKHKALANRWFLLNYQGWEALVDEPLRLRGGKCPFTPSQPARGCINLKAQSLRLLCQLVSLIPPIHLHVWTTPWAWRGESPPRNNPRAAKALLRWWSRLKDSGSCVYAWPWCHRRGTTPERLVCSTSALLSRVLYLCCWIWFPVLTGSTEPVLSLIKGIASVAWICVPGFLSVALK